MAKFLLKFLILVTIIGYSISVPCNQNSWIQLPVTNVAQPVPFMSAITVTGCQGMCMSNNNCTGVAWDTNSSRCYLNFDSSNSGINFTAGPTSNYYSLIRNYSTCDGNNYNCTLNWIGIKDNHGFEGSQIDRSTVVDCVRACQDNISCVAVDWNYQENSCWIFGGNPYTTVQSGIFHFTKNCTGGLPSTASQNFTPRLSTVGPNTTTSTSTMVPTTTGPSTVSSRSKMDSPTSSSSPRGMALEMSESTDWYPLAIRPAYIVLAGVGGGCILLVITAVVILCEYSLNKSFYATNGSAPKSVHAYQSEAPDTNYGESEENAENLDMNEVEMDIDRKPYGNAEEFQ